MFRRKKVELEDEKSVMETNQSSDELGFKPGARPSVALNPGKTPVLPPRPDTAREPVRPAIEIPRPGATPTAAGAAQPARRSETEHRKLIVGREIALSGEITSC